MPIFNTILKKIGKTVTKLVPAAVLSTPGLKTILKNAALSAVNEVERSFIEGTELSQETRNKMKKAAALACAIEQMRSKGALTKVLTLFAKSALSAAIEEIKSPKSAV